MPSSQRPLAISLQLVLSSLVAAGCGGDSGSGSAVADTHDLTPGNGSASTNDGQFPTDPAEEQVFVGDVCAASVAAETFTSALCSCEDTKIAGYLRTRSRRSGSTEEQPGGNVGVNRDYVTAGYADVGGSFAVAGERDVSFAGFLKAGEDLRFAPAFDVAGVVNVARDAWLSKQVRAFGRVQIGGDLHTPAGAGFRGIALVDVGGSEVTEAVTVDPPCPCAPEQIIDVGALVDAAASDNDNASVGLEQNSLDAVIGIGKVLTLPTGRYYVHQIGGIGAVTLHVTGKAALFVADDLLATGVFRLELDPDAEIDLYVKDNLVVTGAARFGDPDRPAATRVYVGGTGDIAIAGAAAFVGNLYAPTANVLLGGFGRVDGSLFAKNVVAAGFLQVAYDSAITDPGGGCPPVGANDIPRIR